MVDTPTTPVLSFPAILRNPGLKDRYAHLYSGGTTKDQAALGHNIRTKKVRRDQNEGKRWIRRKENARFVGNPHVVAANRKDYILPTPSNKPTFPEPLPPFLPRTAKVPVATLPIRDPISANAGRFSLSLKGMRRELRRAGGKAEALVRDVEDEMLEWLQGGVLLRPDESNATGLTDLNVNLDNGRMIGNTGCIIEVSRTPLQLVWSIADDSFARYVVHCCARYHEVISFSKGNSNERLTYLLRPNVRQPDFRATISLDTPPVTDLEYSSQAESTDIDSDFVSERELNDSDIEEPTSTTNLPQGYGNLSSIQETSLPPSPLVSNMETIESESNNEQQDGDGWSVISADADDSSSEAGLDLVDSITGLHLQDSTIAEEQSEEIQSEGLGDPDVTMTQEDIGSALATLTLQSTNTNPEVESENPMDLERIPYHHQQIPHRRIGRNTSSPSRSPVRSRRFTPRKQKRLVTSMNLGGLSKPSSFYEYLFS